MRASIDSLSPQLGPFLSPTVIAVDASFQARHECRCSCANHRREDLCWWAHRIWKLMLAEPLDLELTIEAWLLEAHARGRVQAIVVDPYQMHRSITTLQRRGLSDSGTPQTRSATSPDSGRRSSMPFNGQEPAHAPPPRGCERRR